MKNFKFLLLISLISIQYSCQTKEKNKQSKPSLEKKTEIKTETKSKTVYLNDIRKKLILRIREIQ